MVRLVAHVMWYPSATNPYIAPSARPVTTSWTTISGDYWTGTILPPFQTTMM